MQSGLDNVFIEMIVFSIHGNSIMVEKTHIQQMLSSPEGAEYSLLDLNQIISQTDLVSGQDNYSEKDFPARYLQIKTLPDKLLAVNEPIDIIQLPAKLIKPLPAMLKKRLKFDFIQAISIWQEGIALIINPLNLTE